jgi:hypothetical protein
MAEEMMYRDYQIMRHASEGRAAAVGLISATSSLPSVADAAHGGTVVEAVVEAKRQIDELLDTSESRLDYYTSSARA